MKSQKITKMLGSVAMLGVLMVVSSSSAFAYQGNSEGKNSSSSKERRAEMTEIFANHDYNTWKELVEGKPIAKMITNEEEFDLFVEAHELMLAGDRDAAKKIRAELGLAQRDGFRDNENHKKRKGHKYTKSEIAQYNN